MASANDIRKGNVILLDGDLFLCTDFHHNTPGNKRGIIQAKLKNLASGTIINRKFSSTERVEFAFLDKRPCEYLYRDGASHVFMDSETYEQFFLADEQVGHRLLPGHPRNVGRWGQSRRGHPHGARRAGWG